MLDHNEIYAFCAAHVGKAAFVQYEYSTTADARSATAVTATIPNDYELSETVVVTTRRRNGSIVEEHFTFPHAAFCYFVVSALDSNKNIINTMKVDPQPPTNPSPDPPKRSSEEQRAMILQAVSGANDEAARKRQLLAEMMTAFETKAAAERLAAAKEAERQRTQLLEEQRAAAAAAAAERAAEARKAEAERKSLFDAIKALAANQFPGGQALAGHGAQSANRRGASRGRTFDDDDEDASAAAAATDVDDDNDCANALSVWKTRHCGIPKHKRFLSAWYASEMDEAAFQQAWARKFETDAETSARDTCEALALETAICALHRALRASNVGNTNVAVYAVSQALTVLMQLGEKFEMRQRHATAEALSAFDVALAENDRKCRRRATDNLTLEQLSATAMRKHPRNKKSDRRGGGRRSRDTNARDDSSAASSRAQSVDRATTKTK